MTQSVLFYIVIVSVLLVLVVLMVGVTGFARGTAFHKKHANRIMRYRIVAQAVAVLLILLFVGLREIAR